MRLFKGLQKRQVSYTDTLISWLQSRARGSKSTVVDGGSSVETAAGIVSRAFAACTIVTNSEVIRDALHPSLMALIGRALIEKGECALWIDLGMDGLRMFPASSWSLTGSYDPDSWEYELLLPGPSRSASVTAPASSVIHVRSSADTEQPWRGVGAVQKANRALALEGGVRESLKDETNLPRGAFLPVPRTDGASETLAALKADIAGATGDMLMVESMADQWQSGGTQPSANWHPRKFGPSPPAELIKLYEESRVAMIQALGINPSMFSTQGQASREGWRQTLFAVLLPLGRLLSSELSVKLEREVTLDWSSIRASDLQARARSFRSLVQGGMDVEKAAAVSGLTLEE